jgi:hypothetical protein
LWDKTRTEIVFELQQLKELVDSSRHLIDKTRDTSPDRMEIVVLASMLHSFYNGIENIFKRIALDSDGAVPTGASWHSELLDSMARAAASRPPAISQALQERLWDYLAFRHVFRSVYSFLLQWDRMAPLVFDCQSTLQRLEMELSVFLSSTSD